MLHSILTNRRRSHILLYLVMTRHTMLEPDLIPRIRHIFLHPAPHVSIMQATRLLGWSRREMSAAIESGEVELWSTPLGKWVPRAEMMAKGGWRSGRSTSSKRRSAKRHTASCRGRSG